MENKKIYYIGIGASAGGLEAIQDFFDFMPEHTDMVFIVVQHLAPDYKSLMDEILARHTKMNIKVISNEMETIPNHIYLIPPKHNLHIKNGKLYLEKYHNKTGLNLPIDTFLKSLAIDKKEKSVGIILSGTGSDGAIGVRAIKEYGGLVLAQDANSAQFDGMPKSAISTGVVDYILYPKNMPEELLRFVNCKTYINQEYKDFSLIKGSGELNKIEKLIKEFSGVDFSEYKENTLNRRIERRISINKLNSLETYLEYLYFSNKEKEILYNELLINVTNFFRDNEAFEIINKSAIPHLFNSNKKTIRIWSAGCSTGEEVYSLAIIIKEYISKNKLDCDFKIFATDISQVSLNIASKGFYLESIKIDVGENFLIKYFDHIDGGYQVKEFLRKHIVFALHNVLNDPPFSKIDFLICRNLFIYLKSEVQKNVLNSFLYSLNEDGILFLGSSESLGVMEEFFQVIDSRWKIYKKKTSIKREILSNSELPKIIEKHEKTLNTKLNSSIDLKIKIDKIMEKTLSKFMPPSVIIDENNNIVRVINDMNSFLDIKSGKFSLDITKNLIDGLGIFVSSIIRRLSTEKKEVVFSNISGIRSFGNSIVTIKGDCIDIEDKAYYILSFIISCEKNENILIDNACNYKDVELRVIELEKELQITKENLHGTVEDLEASNEELQSSNEELIASNEELQSMNEELQSVNEELYTVNSEYQSKIEQLTCANNDYDNLLKNIRIGALYLDYSLCIRRITPLISEITNILPSDVGRPINHISFLNEYKHLIDCVNSVCENLNTVETEIVDIENKIWLVRISPYRTEHNFAEGVLLTFIDVNQLKQQQSELIDTKNRLEEALKIGNMAWWEWDLKNNNVIFDDRKATMIGYTVEEFPKDVYGICSFIHPDDYEYTMQAMRDCLEGKSPVWEVVYRIKRKDGGYSWYSDRGVITKRDGDGNPIKLIGTVLDATKYKEIEIKLRENNINLNDILKE